MRFASPLRHCDTAECLITESALEEVHLNTVITEVVYSKDDPVGNQNRDPVLGRMEELVRTLTHIRAGGALKNIFEPRLPKTGSMS